MTTANMSVTQIWADEVDLVTPLFCAYLDFYRRPVAPPEAGAYLQARLARAESVIYLARLDGAPAGFCQLYPSFGSLALRRIWILYDLFVAPDYRRRGVAGALLRRARQLGRDTGAAYLELSTARDNEAAQALYERHGWVRDTEFYSYELALSEDS